MKYLNAGDVLPGQLLSMIQKYYQGGYLYIPKVSSRQVRRQTDYKIELAKRNQHIYLQHLEGKTNGQLGTLYHLSDASIRRILAKEKERYLNMKELIEQILSLWGIENGQIIQIYPSAWEIGHSYVLKTYEDKEQLERNIKISTILSDCNIPVAQILPTQTGEPYAEHKNLYFFMTHKLQGRNITFHKDNETARKMGCAIAKLHKAFLQCEKEIPFWDNSLLKEMQGWIRDTLIKNEWQIIKETEYLKTVETLQNVYDRLPRQLIHRDVHFGNFLFFEGSLSGYIDFDLSQRNIRIFDICYFLTGLLAEETESAFLPEEWIENVKALIRGYESILPLSAAEKDAVPCVMKCIEILFAAYYIDTEDIKLAHDACNVFHFIQNCESGLINAI